MDGPCMEDAIINTNPSPPRVDQGETLFLIIHHLRHNTPLHDAAHLLEAHALEHGLLPARTDVDGVSHRASYTALQQLHHRVHPNALLELLTQPLQSMRTRGMPGAANVTTLLGTGVLSC